MKILSLKMMLPLLALLLTFSSVFAQKVNPNVQKLDAQKLNHEHVCTGHHHRLLQEQEELKLPIPDASNSVMTLNPPTNVKVNVEGTAHLHITWDEPNNCSNCSYAILIDDDGILSNGYHAYLAAGSKTYKGIHRTYHNTGLTIGQTFNVYVQSNIYGTSNYSAFVDAGTYKYEWKTLGATNNQLNITYEGWTTAQENEIKGVVARMRPILNAEYGYPSRTIDVVIRKENNYGPQYDDIDNVIQVPENRILVNREWHLLTHELAHAWRDNVTVTSTPTWNYDPLNSGFEEGFAQTAANDCMNEYILAYPNDYDLSGTSSIKNKEYIYNSTRAWDYDLHDQTALSTGAFYTGWALNRGLELTRYEVSAAALKKIDIENDDFYKDFNNTYYATLNANQSTPVSRTMISNVIATVAPQIEGKPAAQWLNDQEIFDCQYTSGRKIFNLTLPVFGNNSFFMENRYFYYETFSTGMDYLQSGGTTTWNHLNGTTGTGRIYDHAGNLKKSFSPVLSNQSNGYGSYSVSLYNYATNTTGSNYLYWGEPVTLGLYKIQMTFGSTTKTDYRVVGTQLNSGDGVFGGILNGNGGEIFIDHESYSPQASLPIVNGAFQGSRSWLNIANANTGAFDSAPGKLTIRYVDANGNEYVTYRNIDIGNGRGLQQFIFDVNEMTPVVTCAAPASSDFQILNYCSGYIKFRTVPFTGTNHQFRYRKSGNATWINTTATTAKDKNIGVLNQCTTYEVQMRVYCATAQQWSNWSSTLSKKTRPQRNNVNGLQPDPHSTYAYLTSYYHGGDRKQFRVWGPGLSTTYKSTTSYYVTYQNLTPNTTYNYQVRRQCGTTGTWSCFSSVRTFTTTASGKAASEDGQIAIKQEPMVNGDVNLFPNPVSGDVINVSVTDPSKTIEFIELMNINGQVLVKQAYNNQSLIQLSVNELPKGMYLVRINGQVTQRFVR